MTKRSLYLSVTCLMLWGSLPVHAVDTGAVLGGAVGGGVGAAVGSEVGGRDGAIIGGAVGGGLGAAIGSNDEGPEKEKTLVYVETPRQSEPPGRAYGHRTPPGHAKQKHKYKHR